MKRYPGGSIGGVPLFNAANVKYVESSNRAKIAKPWICDECGRRMTEKQAVRAMEKGCPKGCSGLDVREVELEDAK